METVQKKLRETKSSFRKMCGKKVMVRVRPFNLRHIPMQGRRRGRPLLHPTTNPNEPNRRHVGTRTSRTQHRTSPCERYYRSHGASSIVVVEHKSGPITAKGVWGTFRALFYPCTILMEKWSVSSGNMKWATNFGIFCIPNFWKFFFPKNTFSFMSLLPISEGVFILSFNRMLLRTEA